MATIKEVAARARVSVATVSRVVNNSGYVSGDLRERVEEAMQALQYKPSALARSLRRQETHTIGVLIPQLNQPFFSTLAFAVEKTLFARDYRSLICSSEEDPAKEAAYADILLRQRVDGVIVAPTGHSTDGVNRLVQARIPLVLIDRDLAGAPTINRVLSDNYGGAYTAVRHLLTLGHRRIAIIAGLAHSQPIHLRLDGLKQAFREFNAAPDPELMRFSTLAEFELGYQSTLELMKLPQPPTAVFALSDVIAVGVLHAAAELGLKLPDELSVMGYDDIPLAAYVIPALTTIAQPIYAMGQTAVEILMRRFEDHAHEPETIQLESRLVVRNSTAAPLN